MEGSCHKVTQQLKQGWEPNVERIIRENFEKGEKGWLNLSQKNDFVAYE
jgi:hypothetical protein